MTDVERIRDAIAKLDAAIAALDRVEARLHAVAVRLERVPGAVAPADRTIRVTYHGAAPEPPEAA